MSAAWEFVLALSNLRLPPQSDAQPGVPGRLDLGTDLVALVPGDDADVLAIRRESPAVEQILTAFRNEYGESVTPSVILVRRSAPHRLRVSAEAFQDFRNAIAIAAVLPGRAAVAQGNKGLSASWSDVFDFHAARLGGQGSAILQSDAIVSRVGDGPLFLSPDPAVPVFSREITPDQFLYRAFSRAWRRRHGLQPVDDHFGRTLFRSLELAYHASGVGNRGLGSPADYGVQVGLWVSAFEVLCGNARRAMAVPGARASTPYWISLTHQPMHHNSAYASIESVGGVAAVR